MPAVLLKKSELPLVGVLPFWGGTSENVSPLMVMQEILGGDIRFDGAPWEGISSEAIDFVNRLLDRDYNTRLTAEQALQHPWIADLFCEAETEHSGACCPQGFHRSYRVETVGCMHPTWSRRRVRCPGRHEDFGEIASA